jgi:undecaprenyl-diphosphatase
MLERFDFPIQKFLSGFAGQNAHFDQLIYGLSRADALKGIIMMSFLWLAWFYRPSNYSVREEKDRQIHLLVVVTGTVATVVFSRLLQLVLHVHKRPLLAGFDLRFPDGIDMTSVNQWNSFPSDHAMLFFALGTGIWQLNRWMGAFIFFWSTFFICLPRIYLGMHYPSDVVAGSVLGVLCMLGFERLPVHNFAARLHAWSKTHPGLFFWSAFMFTDQLGHLFDSVRNIAALLAKFFRS